MARVVITAPVTVSGNAYHRGEVIEASAALVTALGANARAVTARDQLGEGSGVSNSD